MAADSIASMLLPLTGSDWKRTTLLIFTSAWFDVCYVTLKLRPSHKAPDDIITPTWPRPRSSTRVNPTVSWVIAARLDAGLLQFANISS